jgi:hypothetical protein
MLQVMVFGLGLSLVGCAKNSDSKLNDSAVTKFSMQASQASRACFAENFQVPPSEAKPVDVLFVVQTSPSMSDIREKITTGINSFVSGLPANSNFNIAVMLSHGSTSNLSGKLYQAGDEPLVLKSSELTNAQIQTYLDAKLMQTPSDVESGGGEEGLYSLFHGITDGTLLSQSQTADFFRLNAALGVVFIADRRDICANVPAGVPAETDPVKIDARIRDCEGLTAAGLTNRLALLKGAQPAVVSGIIYVDEPAPAGKEIGYGYKDMISLNGGSAIDIANDDISMGLAPIKALSGQAPGQQEFVLGNADVDLTTLMVTVSGETVPYTYDGTKVTITVPVPAGATVVISYCIKGDNPYVGLCKVFENADQWDSLTPTPSTEDLQLKNKSGNSSVDAVRNLQVQSVSGGLSVQSAMAISSISSVSGKSYLRVSGDIDSISNVSGNLRIDKAGDVGKVSKISGAFQLNALSLGEFSNASGKACIRAGSIGKVQSTSGDKTFIANEIDELTAQSGTVHVYGAVIRSVTNSSGRICLHNGAKVLNSSHVSGFIGECP